jgi:hypothetical protein
MAHLITLSNLLAAICSALAAYYWFRATQVKDPPATLQGSFGFGTRTPPFKPTGGVNSTPLVKWAQDSGKANRVAASWSAAAAFFAFLSWGLGLLAHS